MYCIYIYIYNPCALFSKLKLNDILSLSPSWRNTNKSHVQLYITRICSYSFILKYFATVLVWRHNPIASPSLGLLSSFISICLLNIVPPLLLLWETVWFGLILHASWMRKLYVSAPELIRGSFTEHQFSSQIIRLLSGLLRSYIHRRQSMRSSRFVKSWRQYVFLVERILCIKYWTSADSCILHCNIELCFCLCAFECTSNLPMYETLLLCWQYSQVLTSILETICTSIFNSQLFDTLRIAIPVVSVMICFL